MKRPVVIAVAVVILLVALILGIRWMRGTAPPPPPPPPPAPAVEPEPVVEAPPPLPPLEEADAAVRELARALGVPERFLGAIDGNVVRLFVRVIDTVAEGESPRKLLPFLAPRGDYLVIYHGDRVYPDPVSYRRYDGVADAIASIDVAAAVEQFARLEPLADQAYEEIGGPPGGFRDRLIAALELLVATPVPASPPELVDVAVDRFAYVDPQLESLKPAQKHLLRFGPDNERRVQETLAALAAGLRR